MSVRPLYWHGTRQLDAWVKTIPGVVGWLLLEPAADGWFLARLVDDAGKDLMEPLPHAGVQEGKGKQGMLVRGWHVREGKRGIPKKEEQAWWCHAPPKPAPFAESASQLEIRRYERLTGRVFGSWYDADEGPA